MPDQTWDLWFPSTGADGPPFCRAVVSDRPGDVVLLHAAPPRLDVTVRGAASLSSVISLPRRARPSLRVRARR